MPPSRKIGRDAETLAAWLREAADELERAHLFLDHLGVPHSIPGNEPVECTLAARISLLADASNSEPCHICGRRRDEPGEMYCSAAHPLAANSEAGNSN